MSKNKIKNKKFTDTNNKVKTQKSTQDKVEFSDNSYQEALNLLMFFD